MIFKMSFSHLFNLKNDVTVDWLRSSSAKWKLAFPGNK